MASKGGILVLVASNMIKPSETEEIRHAGEFEFAMMLYTAVMVTMTDFLTLVLSALVIYYVVKYVFKRIEKKKTGHLQLEFRGAQRACHETPVESDRFLLGCRELILNFCR